MCHLLLALPLVALPVFWLLPLGVALPLYVLALGFSGWMYRALMRTSHQHATSGGEALLHATAEVVEAAAGKALVRIGGELWTARYRGDLHPGDPVEVDGRHGLVLSLVAAAPSAGRAVEPAATGGRTR